MASRTIATAKPALLPPAMVAFLRRRLNFVLNSPQPSCQLQQSVNRCYWIVVLMTILFSITCIVFRASSPGHNPHIGAGRKQR